MESLINSVKKILPNLDGECLTNLEETLTDLGVTTEQECRHIKEEDLTPILKKIQVRRLLEAWCGECYFMLKWFKLLKYGKLFDRCFVLL